MDKNVTGSEVVDGGFARVLFALKNNIMKDLNVADVARITAIKDDNNIYCSSLTNPSITLVCTKLKNLELSKEDCVLILYTNEDFRTNLSRFKNNQSISAITTTDKHTKNYGIIIGVL